MLHIYYKYKKSIQDCISTFGKIQGKGNNPSTQICTGGAICTVIIVNKK